MASERVCAVVEAANRCVISVAWGVRLMLSDKGSLKELRREN